MKMNEQHVHTVSPSENTQVEFEYHLQMDYEKEVQKAFFTIRAIPGSNERQKITELSFTLNPESVYSRTKDGLGNTMIYGSIDEPHIFFEYTVRGKAEIGQILFEEYAGETEAMIYRHPHGRNQSGTGIKTYFETLKPELEENVYVNAICLMRHLHRDFVYQKGITGISTSAEEAWMLGGGVCQDYTHIFIALCHLAKIPARYAAGIIAGEGESHAWAEILYHGKWIGMDPTNDLLVGRSHIKFAHGRDAVDCLLNRGILYGGGRQTQKVHVRFEE